MKFLFVSIAALDSPVVPPVYYKRMVSSSFPGSSTSSFFSSILGGSSPSSNFFGTSSPSYQTSPDSSFSSDFNLNFLALFFVASQIVTISCLIISSNSLIL